MLLVSESVSVLLYPSSRLVAIALLLVASPECLELRSPPRHRKCDSEDFC